MIRMLNYVRRARSAGSVRHASSHVLHVFKNQLFPPALDERLQMTQTAQPRASAGAGAEPQKIWLRFEDWGVSAGCLGELPVQVRQAPQALVWGEFYEWAEYRRHCVCWPVLRRLGRMNDAKGLKVLEIGFGLGLDLLTYCREGASAWGLEKNPEAVNAVKSRMQELGFKAALSLGDAHELPYEDGSFDLVYCFDLIGYLSDPHKAVREIQRVLKPGGTALIGLSYSHALRNYTVKIADWLVNRGELWRRYGLDFVKLCHGLPLEGRFYDQKSAIELFGREQKVKLAVLNKNPVNLLGRYVDLLIVYHEQKQGRLCNLALLREELRTSGSFRAISYRVMRSVMDRVAAFILGPLAIWLVKNYAEVLMAAWQKPLKPGAGDSG
jgi:SAM-dependent methyltransferase